MLRSKAVVSIVAVTLVLALGAAPLSAAPATLSIGQSLVSGILDWINQVFGLHGTETDCEESSNLEDPPTDEGGVVIEPGG